MLKKIFNWFRTSKNKSAFTIIETLVPDHIRVTGRQYPIVFTHTTNLAAGEIRKIKFEKNTILRPGQAFIFTDKYGVVHTWVYLGYDFFKLVLKA
jgi:hypothetical protein